jgi:hypothetical protein
MKDTANTFILAFTILCGCWLISRSLVLSAAIQAGWAVQTPEYISLVTFDSGATP